MLNFLLKLEDVSGRVLKHVTDFLVSHRLVLLVTIVALLLLVSCPVYGEDSLRTDISALHLSYNEASVQPVAFKPLAGILSLRQKEIVSPVEVAPSSEEPMGMALLAQVSKERDEQFFKLIREYRNINIAISAGAAAIATGSLLIVLKK